jgi:hypothetical protein
VTVERALHLDVGAVRRLGPSTELRVDLYARREHDMLRLEDAEARMTADGLVRPAFDPLWTNAVTGKASGVEILVRRSAISGLTGWLAYGFGRARHTDVLRGEEYRADFDQRHMLNAYGHYRLSSRTSFTARLRVGSNFPLPGYFEQVGDDLYVGAARNTVNLPVYARLDLRASRAYNYTKRRLTLFVEVLNVLNRDNIGPASGIVRATGLTEGFVEHLFPVLPSAGLRIDF